LARGILRPQNISPALTVSEDLLFLFFANALRHKTETRPAGQSGGEFRVREIPRAKK